MPSLKGILFNQFAGEGLSDLIEEMQKKYNPKKGRRFNHADITYEISRPSLKENLLEFEISSKIPQDEVKDDKAMDKFFDSIEKILNKEDKKPVSIERENIVWDSKKDTEKERDYVKCLYSYPLEELYTDEEVVRRFEKVKAEGDNTPNISGVFTPQGKVALMIVRERIKELGAKHIETLIDANKQVRDSLKN